MLKYIYDMTTIIDIWLIDKDSSLKKIKLIDKHRTYCSLSTLQMPI